MNLGSLARGVLGGRSRGYGTTSHTTGTSGGMGTQLGRMADQHMSGRRGRTSSVGGGGLGSLLRGMRRH